MSAKPKLVGLVGKFADVKFGIGTAPAELLVDTAGITLGGESKPLMDSNANTVAMAFTKNGEKKINYSGTVLQALDMEPGKVISVVDPITSETTTGIVESVNLNEAKEDWLKGSFSIGIYPAMDMSTVHGYKGPWDADANLPALADTDIGLLAGDGYLVSKAGSVDFGAGAIVFAINDVVEWDGTAWQKQV